MHLSDRDAALGEFNAQLLRGYRYYDEETQGQ
jgi:hypothetical protein